MALDNGGRMMAEKKGTSIIKFTLIFVIILIGLPLGIMTMFYFTNSTFQSAANEYLKEFPVIGSHFSKIPTDEEKMVKIADLAAYYKDLDPLRAAERLYIIRQDDEELYNDIIDVLKKNYLRETKDILEKIRNIEIRDDILISLYDEMQQEKEAVFVNEATRLEGMDIKLAIEEIKESVAKDDSNVTSIAKTLNSMKNENASKILYYLDDTLQSDILSIIEDIDEENAKVLDALVDVMQYENKKLLDLAEIYETKDIETAFGEIGGTSLYSVDDLAVIYMNLSPKKSAEILFNSQDQQFIDKLFKSISEKERLDNIQTSVTIEISQILSYLNEYNSKIDELVKIYEKMEPSTVGQIVEDMLRNDSTISSFEIDTNELYKVSDASIVLDVLRKMNKTNLSKIIDTMSSRRAAELSRKLILE